jgi:hypothetical protein
MKSIAKSSFFAGFLASMAIKSLMMDYHGQTKMIELMQTAWINSSITGPLACTALLAAIFIYLKANGLEKWFQAYTNKLLTEWGKKHANATNNKK